MAAIFAHGFGSALLLGLAGSLAQRVRTCDAMRVEGLVLQAPALAGLAVVGLGTSLGVPGLAGSWGIFVTLIGGFVRHPALACVLGVALVVSAVAHIRMARLLLLGRVDPAWGRSHHLEPFGGRLPDASSYELVAFVPLAALAILLGFWPAPVLSSFATSARDRSSELDLDIAK
jgi:NADH-quinone oxidoreductase subunit M